MPWGKGGRCVFLGGMHPEPEGSIEMLPNPENPVRMRSHRPAGLVAGFLVPSLSV